MNFKEYQEFTKKTAIYPDNGKNLTYVVLGLVGEAGEVAEKVKKIIRDKDGVLSDETRLELIKELGDVLWYISQSAFELDHSLDEVAELNVKKLSSRHERGMAHGEGDNR